MKRTRKRPILFDSRDGFDFDGESRARVWIDFEGDECGVRSITIHFEGCVIRFWIILRNRGFVSNDFDKGTNFAS